MNKKVLSIVFLLIIAVVLAYVFWPEESALIEDIRYSEYSLDWIEELEISSAEGKTHEINIVEATEGHGNFMVDQERFIDVDGKIISLFYGGSYNGEIFNNMYYDKNEDLKMRIWNNMNPNDNIIEGFGLFKKENSAFVIYLFIDEDWKKQSNGNINIIWGNDITDKENLNSKKFDFSNEKNGIYVEKITKDVSWFAEQNPIIGRLFFGEISLQDIKESNYEKTFIALT